MGRYDLGGSTGSSPAGAWPRLVRDAQMRMTFWRRRSLLASVSPNLSVLPAGQAGGTTIAALSSDGMRMVVSEAAKQFDWVLLDTPPVGLLSDAHLVARVTDGVLFVIAAGSTPYSVVQRSIAEIGADRIVGTVLNRVEPSSLPAQDYYGRYYSRRHD